jgi:hypothetical protein
MSQIHFKKMALLSLAVTILVGVAAAVGVFLRGDGAGVELVSPRGETYIMVTDGIYRFNGQRVVAEGVGWDIFTLFIAVPAMLFVLPLVARGSLRGRLFAIGLLAYFFYQYLMYALTWALGPLLLLFIPIYTLSFAAALWMATTISIADLAGQATEHFPRRGMAVLCGFMAFLLLGMWLPMIMAGLRGDFEQGPLFGQTTMVVQVMDLGMIAPLAIFTAVALWRRWPVGILLGTIFVVKAVAMSAAITAMLISAWMVEGSPEVAFLSIFIAAAALSIWLGVRMYRSLQPAVLMHAREISTLS